jgi:uncharacterized protein
MVDLEKLDAHLTSEASPEDSLTLSDLDGFLTGILCSPELIPPSEWLPIVWRSEEPNADALDQHIWATQTILERYNEIASFLNSEPPFIEPIFWQAKEGHVIAMDWCEGFAEAYELCQDGWMELLVTPEGQAWMEPVFAHLFDEDGVSLSGASEQELDKVLDEEAEKIPELIPNIFTYWKAQRAPKS